MNHAFEVSIHFTFYLWWLYLYLAIGVVLFLPLNWLALKQIANPDPFWVEVRRSRWSSRLIQVVAWPLAIWEVLRWPVKKAWRSRFTPKGPATSWVTCPHFWKFVDERKGDRLFRCEVCGAEKVE